MPFVLLSMLSISSGVMLICLALCADAVIGNVQEKAMKAYKAPNTEVVSMPSIRDHHPQMTGTLTPQAM